jgi:putative tryptophan/tyrosine transport system substrate-binding protein
LAAKAATRKIPIVIMAGDPVEQGLIESLARPGGNITGLSLMAVPLHVKGVELMRDIQPTMRRVAILGNTADPAFAKMLLDTALRAVPGAGIDVHPVMTSIAEAEAAFATIAKEGAEGVVVQGSLSAAKIADLAIKHRLLASSFVRSFVEVGGLVSYGPHGPTTYRRSAIFVQKILQGGNPATISVEQPTKFELAVNQKTAKAIGIEIPETFLSRADTVIE